jgi:hypothetical protein
VHKKAIRFSDDQQIIIDKVRDAFDLSSDGEAVRFVLNFWWQSLGSDAVDVKKLGNMLSEEHKRAEGE